MTGARQRSTPRASIAALAIGLALGQALGLAAPRDAHAQATCNVNNQASCQLGGTAATAVNITISPVIWMSLSNGAVALGTATAAQFTAGFGTPFALPITVRANIPWSVSLAALSPTWTGTPLTAWQLKPASDLEWSLAVAGPYTALAVTPATLGTGSMTAGTVIPLFLRPRYSWANDVPGSYSLPLQFTITAP